MNARLSGGVPALFGLLGWLAMLGLLGAAGLATARYEAGGAALLALLGAIVAMALPYLLLGGRAGLFLCLLAGRAACDPLLDMLKPEDGGGMGVGAALNALVIALAALCVLRRPRPFLRRVMPVWGAFLLTALLSATLAPDLSNALRLFLVQVSYCAVFAMPFYLIGSPADLRLCLRVLLYSSAPPVLVALPELALGAGALSDPDFRLKSTFSHANIFAFYLMFHIALLLYLQKSRAAVLAPRTRWCWGLYLLLLLVLLLATKTRSAWGGCLLIFVVYGGFFQRRFLLYALLAPCLLLLEPGLRERVLELMTSEQAGPGGGLNSYAWRLLLWKSGLAWMQQSHVLFGYGLDAFKYYSPDFFPLPGRDSWDPHNVYVQLYFETGVAGLLAAAWMGWRLLRWLWRGLAHDKAGATIVLALVAAYLLVCYSDNMLYYLSFNWSFWFFIGCACADIAARDRFAFAEPGAPPSFTVKEQHHAARP